MAMMPPTFRSKVQQRNAAASKQRAKASYDERRGSANSRGYDADWQSASIAHRNANPLCAYSELEGVTAACELVDHLYPHCGDRRLFWLKDYWVSSTKTMHDGFKARIEADGIAAIDRLAIALGKLPLVQVDPDLARFVAMSIGARRRQA